MPVPRDPGGAPRRVVKAKVKRSPVVAPRPEVSVRAPKVKPRRGSAPNVFTESPIRNPIEKIQTKQLRQTARAEMNAAHAMRGNADAKAVPKAPARPLTNREAARVLNSGIGRSVAATVPKVKVKKSGGKGGKGLPLAVLSDIPKELSGAGAVEAAITRIGATSAKGWQSVPIVGHEIGNVVKDTAGLAAGAVPSIYLPARDVVTGHPGKAVSTLYKGVKETVKHPAEHPVSLALIVRGGEGAVSRGAGELVRHSPSNALREYGSTERMPLSLGGTPHYRRASKGLIENRIQKATDRRQERGKVEVQHGPIASSFRGQATWHAHDADHPVNVTGVLGEHNGVTYMSVEGSQSGVPLSELTADRKTRVSAKTTLKVPVRDSEGNLKYIAKVPAIKASKRQLEQPHVLGGKLNRRVDTEAGKANARVRDMPATARTALDKVKPKHGAEDAAALVNEGVIKRGNVHRPLSPETLREDLTSHVQQLREQRGRIPANKPALLADNAAAIAQVERVLANDKFLRDPQSVFKAGRVYANTHRPLEAKRGEYGDLTKGQIEGRPLLVFAVREMGLHHQGPDKVAIRQAQSDVAAAESALEAATKSAKPGATRPLKEAQGLFEAKARLKALKNEYTGFVTPDGVPVSNQRIVNAFTAKGGDPKDLAYLPTKADFTGARNFSGSRIRRSGAETNRFTGAAAKAGTYERGWEVMRQQLSNAAVKVARHQSVSNLIDTFGRKQPNGKFWDGESAAEEIRHQREANGHEYVAVTAARKTAPDTLVDDLSPAEMEQAFRTAEPGDSHVVLFPKQVWDRLQAHEQGRGKVRAPQVFQQASQTFRHVVLSTSMKWLGGNAAENYLRMQINELTPMQVASTIRAGKRIEKKLASFGPLGEQRAAELRGTAGPGLQGSQSKLDYHNPDSALENSARRFRQSGFGPGKKIGPKGIADLWDGYRHAITALNRLTEDGIYHYGIGKEARHEVQQITTLWDRALRRAGPAYEAVARGLLDSNKIAQYADAVDAVRGRYVNLSPDGRYLVSTYTPFAPWYVNALHFFAITLPGHHPVKTGILAAASVGTKDKRDELNLPPWAQGIPYGDGKVLPIQNYLPTGITSNGTGGVSSLILPQIAGIQKNLNGQAWTGQQLPPGTSNIEMAMNTAAGTFIPFYSRVQTVMEKGGKQQGDSTLWDPKVKDGTEKNIGAGVIKAVAPIRPQDTSGSSGGGSTWGSAGGSSGSSSGWGTAGG